MKNCKSNACAKCKGDRCPDESVSFSIALVSLKTGDKIYRLGWDRTGSFLFGVPDRSYFFSSRLTETYVDKDVETLPWIAMKTSDNKIVPWTPCQSDILSDDWIIMPKKD